MPVLPATPSLAFSRSDQGGAVGGALGEFHGSLHLGQHGAGGEVAPFHVDLGLGGGQTVQPGLVGLAEVNGHLLHGGEDDEGIGVDLLGQHAGGEVLVDDRRRALEVVAFGLIDRDAAAAAGHHHQSGVHHVADGLNLDDGLGLGRGHHTAVAPARVLNDVIAPLSHPFVGLLLGHEGANGLGGVLESWIFRVDFRLRQHVHKGGTLRHEGSQFLLNHVANHPQGFGTDHIQRIHRNSLIGIVLQSKETHLWAVAVRYHQLVAFVGLSDLFASQANVLALVFAGHRFATFQEGIAAQSNH